MHTEKREDPIAEMGYEIRDVNMKAIRTATLVFFAFAIGSAILGAGIYWLMNPAFHGEREARIRTFPQPPNPLLQDNITSKTDTMILRAREEKALVGAPTQNENGSYRIPVGAAIKMVAEQGGKVSGVRADVPTASTAPKLPAGTEQAPVQDRLPSMTTPMEGGSTAPATGR